MSVSQKITKNDTKIWVTIVMKRDRGKFNNAGVLFRLPMKGQYMAHACYYCQLNSSSYCLMKCKTKCGNKGKQWEQL